MEEFMSEKWVDFSAVKSAVQIEQVLEHYGITWLRKSGDNLAGRCPIHSGEEGSKSFSVNLAKNVYQCFSTDCKSKGNVLDLTAAMEKCSVRDAALKLADWFKIEAATEKPKGRGDTKERKEKLAAGKKEAPAPAARNEPKPAAESAPGEIEGKEGEQGINKPLGFPGLKNLDPAHPYLLERGIERETAEYFGVGYCSKGLMKGRIAIPIHSPAGELVAYCGRWPGDSGWPEGEKKYKLPGGGFKKSWELWNIHRVLKDGFKTVIVCEGYFDAMRVHQAGFPFVVALMGSSMSEAQEKLLVDNFQHAILVLDSDEAGKKGTENIALRLARKLYVRIVDLPDGVQVDKLSEDEIQDILGELP